MPCGQVKPNLALVRTRREPPLLLEWRVAARRTTLR